MTDAVTILAQQRNRLHSHRLYMESITVNHEDELFIWVLKADLACIVYYRSQADTAAEADDRRVISKEAVGNSWGILSTILGHKYHQYHPNRSLQPKSEFDHICVFPYVYAPLTFGLDLVSEERRELQALVYDILPWRKVPESDVRSVGTTCTLPPSWLSGMWVFFLSCTIHVITNLSYFKQNLNVTECIVCVSGYDPLTFSFLSFFFF